MTQIGKVINIMNRVIMSKINGMNIMMIMMKMVSKDNRINPVTYQDIMNQRRSKHHALIAMIVVNYFLL
ncbi:hypothetical protein RirG_007410 [Rhizophagus irregularis DAOM 197198w]|uniref:Uncharacterized protein n=1 Tax=Rhizophagus irregularis (strain DAOM 197198w) TaxID=1432141 RepID=A0A015LHU7_RHIIW|nr:hypothetical protein RirG_007410 [Rhizophagus irregularis DAOM 197198w]